MSEQDTGKPQKAAQRFAEKYNPQFELWYGGILWRAFWSVIDSWKIFEFSEEREHGFSRSISKVPDDLFIRRVLTLRSLLPSSWRMNQGFQAMDEAIRKILHGDEKNGGKTSMPTLVEALDLLEAIVKLLESKHMLRLKPPRDPAE